MKQYYPVDFIVHNQIFHTLWYTDEKDGFVVENGKIKKFSDTKEQIEALREQSVYQEEITCYKTDTILDEIKQKQINCNDVLNFWNIILELSFSIHCSFLGNVKSEVIKRIHAKLFYGCNIKVLRKEDELYIPLWSKTERKKLFFVIEDGLEILKRAFEIS